MWRRALVPLSIVLVTFFISLSLFGLSGVSAAGASASAPALLEAPQRPFTATITTPNSPGDLVFGTYLLAWPPRPAGVSYWVFDMALDGAGNIFVVGGTDDPNFPVTPGLEHAVESGANIFVAKLSPDGATLVYSTVLGRGSATLAVDTAGAVYLTGQTYDENFPVTPGAYATTCGRSSGGFCDDAFVMKLAPDGQIAYSTFLGGSMGGVRTPQDTGFGIAVDAVGDIYVGGLTASDDFPTTAGAFQRTATAVTSGTYDLFFVKLRPGGAGTTDLLYGTYLGGAGQEWPVDIAVDAQGVIYATGGTVFSEGAQSFPTTPGAYDPTPPTVNGDPDAFIVRLNPAGNGAADLLYSTLLGTDQALSPPGIFAHDWGNAIALDGAGAVYVLGFTGSNRFPTTPGAYLPARNFGNFLAKLRPGGQGAADLEYATYLPINAENRTLAVDDQGDAYVGGWPSFDEPPTTPGAFDTDGGSGYMVRLRPAGQGADDLIYGSYLDSGVQALALVEAGTIVVAGATDSCDFPTTANTWQPDCVEGYNVGIAGLRMPKRYLVTGRAVDPDGLPIVNVPITASDVYTAFTNRDGAFGFGLETGESMLTPIQRDFFWDPPQRVVTVPPAASGQGFQGYRVLQKTAEPGILHPMAYGDTITYTLNLRGPGFADAILADPIPTYTVFLSETLRSLPGIVYDAESNAVTGTLPLAAMESGVITFSVRVAVTGTVESGPVIVNLAQVYPAAAPEQAIWSAPVVRFTYPRYIFVPLFFTTEQTAR